MGQIEPVRLCHRRVHFVEKELNSTDDEELKSTTTSYEKHEMGGGQNYARFLEPYTTMFTIEIYDATGQLPQTRTAWTSTY